MNNTLKYRVSFDEADGEGIVFFGNYFRLIHRAFEEFLPAMGIPWEEWFKNPKFGVPLRHAESDYHRSLVPGMIVTITINVERIGDSSVHFIHTIKDEGQNICAILKTSHVFVSRPRESMKKITVPDSIKQRLKPAQLK